MSTMGATRPDVCLQEHAAAEISMQLSWSLVSRFALVLGFAAVANACSAGKSSQPDGSGGSSTTGAFSTGSGTGGFAACKSLSEQATIKPLNLYIMVDKSSSMAGTKWAAAQTGLTTWANDASAAGINVGLSFFPRPADTTPACSQDAYKEPVVPFGVLPGNAQAISDAMTTEMPDGFSSPMYPALGGAILKGIEFEQDNPGQVSAVLVVTDGKADGPAAMCGGVDPQDPAVIAALAKTGADFNPPVITYVVGLPGVDQTSANEIAMAGGSDTAFILGTTNVAQQFHDALAKVRGDALPCEYQIPTSVNSGQVMITDVNIQITPGGGMPAVVPQDNACTGPGWKYDDPTHPTAIVLCPASCMELKEDDMASISILLGCATIVK